MQTKIIKLSQGKELEIMEKGLEVGKRLLTKEGFIQCPNPNFMRKDNITAHYNSLMKCWIVTS